MPVKNILVAVAPGRGTDAGSKFAISMGVKLDAHVTGCIFALEPERRGLSMLNEPIFARHRIRVVAEARSAEKKFRQAGRTAKLDVGVEIFTTTLDEAAKSFSERARVHDVAVITQSRPGLDHVGDVFLEAALFSSGRPVIVVPERSSAAFSTKRVVIAWDGSEYAARAAALSMPILSQASQIKVLVIGNSAKVKASRAKELVAALKRNGFDAKLVSRDHHDDARTIAREAKAWNASLLVMGGYGRSKLREFVLGGVTRYMLLKTPLPVLMAH